LHHCRQDGGDPWRRIAAILAATVQSEFCGIAIFHLRNLRESASKNLLCLFAI
jgi:hypothetical protein